MQPSEEIKQKIDIVDFLREYIQLTPAGMNFRARCPFHNEKTPSFMVSPDKQIWHCFGCGKGGDIFKFLMEMEGIDFVEALRVLAPKAGVQLRRQNPKVASERARLLDIMDISRRYFHKVLMESSSAKQAREYLTKRGLTESDLMEWQIGYSLDSWDGLLKVLKKQGYNETEIEKTGMIISNQQRRSYYDRFRARIMFPINDINGNVVAFSARVSPEKEATEQMGKYINSPQTVLYNKSNILFALDKAKREIKLKDQAIIVEGQMDAVSAHVNGYKNVIASSGTALTIDQLTILKRYSNNIALAFDTDEAGHMAADRGIREAMKLDMNIKVILVPEGKDPDDCIRENPKAWEGAVNNAKHIMEYYFEIVFKGLNVNNIDDKRKAAGKILSIIQAIKNPIESAHWLKVLSEKILVDESVLKEAMPAKVPETVNNAVSNRTIQVKQEELSQAERISELFLSLLVKNFHFIDSMQANVSVEHIFGAKNKALYKNLLFYYNNPKLSSEQKKAILALDFNTFISWLEEYLLNKPNNNEQSTVIIKQQLEDQLNHLNRLVLLADKEYEGQEIDDLQSEINKLILSLKKESIQIRKKELENLISQAEKNNNEDDLDLYFQKLKQLTDEYNILNK